MKREGSINKVVKEIKMLLFLFVLVLVCLIYLFSLFTFKCKMLKNTSLSALWYHNFTFLYYLSHLCIYVKNSI